MYLPEKKTKENSGEIESTSISRKTNSEPKSQNESNRENPRINLSQNDGGCTNTIVSSNCRNDGKYNFSKQSNDKFEEQNPENREQNNKDRIPEQVIESETNVRTIEGTGISKNDKPGEGKSIKGNNHKGRGEQNSDTTEGTGEVRKAESLIGIKNDINYDELIKMDSVSLMKKIILLSMKMSNSEFYSFIKELYNKLPEDDKRKRMIEDITDKLGIKDLLSFLINDKRKIINDD